MLPLVAIMTRGRRDYALHFFKIHKWRFRIHHMIDSITHFFKHIHILKGCMLSHNHQHMGQSRFRIRCQQVAQTK